MSFEAVHAGYGRVLVNGTLSVKALFAGQLFRLHRRHNRRVLRLSVPGRLARRPLRGPRHADPREQRAPPGAGIEVCCCLGDHCGERTGRVGPQAVPPAARGRQ